MREKEVFAAWASSSQLLSCQHKTLNKDRQHKISSRNRNFSESDSDLDVANLCTTFLQHHHFLSLISATIRFVLWSLSSSPDPCSEYD